MREVEDRDLVRGVFRTLPTGRVKATILVESIVPAPGKELVLPARPQGRDWFVKAGATGGDGSKEKPFRDPFQALEKAEGGDSIHIAGGTILEGCGQESGWCQCGTCRFWVGMTRRLRRAIRGKIRRGSCWMGRRRRSGRMMGRF